MQNEPVRVFTEFYMRAVKVVTNSGKHSDRLYEI